MIGTVGRALMHDAGNYMEDVGLCPSAQSYAATVSIVGILMTPFINAICYRMMEAGTFSEEYKENVNLVMKENYQEISDGVRGLLKSLPEIVEQRLAMFEQDCCGKNN